jgi:hypothetical protein
MAALVFLVVGFVVAVLLLRAAMSLIAKVAWGAIRALAGPRAPSTPRQARASGPPSGPVGGAMQG